MGPLDRFIDPRMDPRIMEPRMDPRFVDPRFMDPRFVDTRPGPRPGLEPRPEPGRVEPKADVRKVEGRPESVLEPRGRLEHGNFEPVRPIEPGRPFEHVRPERGRTFERERPLERERTVERSRTIERSRPTERDRTVERNKRPLPERNERTLERTERTVERNERPIERNERPLGREKSSDLRERLERLEARMNGYTLNGRERYVEKYVEQVQLQKGQDQTQQTQQTEQTQQTQQTQQTPASTTPPRDIDSCGPAPSVEMVSRRRILSKSREEINHIEEEDDVWFNKEKLIKDHITEVLMKWEQIDDEIWAKVIVLERNRRVAKAYARAPVLTVNGSDDGFDGFRIGLCGFDNPWRDPRTDDVKRHIGQGVKVKMDDEGNIMIKRVSRHNVYVQLTTDDNAISNEILRLPNAALEPEKAVMLFDIKKFQQNVNRELRRSYPDRSKLENQCVCAIGFVRNEENVLECPIWVLIINIVAMDMLKSKLPLPRPLPSNIRNRPRIPPPDEDPYSVAASGESSVSSSGRERNGKDRPPKLPPRDNAHYPHGVPNGKANGKGDYTAMDENAFRKLQSTRNHSKDKKDRKYDDPYYCGLRARIPNFPKSKSKDKGGDQQTQPLVGPQGVPPQPLGRGQYPPPPLPNHPSMWHSRSFDSGMDSDYTDSHSYSHIYGRLPLPNRAYLPPPLPHPRTMYVSEWN
ncbi:uncharacterized protein LOC143018549 isoform X2 [Oratosquilla oratoria]|uniref:uncharacterized protein LOC143018549 isoform X2 n=1 Tax=Oratosquilla oratoria TaxID=337810 RepID=UPI003F777163